MCRSQIILWLLIATATFIGMKIHFYFYRIFLFVLDWVDWIHCNSYANAVCAYRVSEIEICKIARHWREAIKWWRFDMNIHTSTNRQTWKKPFKNVIAELKRMRDGAKMRKYFLIIYSVIVWLETGFRLSFSDNSDVILSPVTMTRWSEVTKRYLYFSHSSFSRMMIIIIFIQSSTLHFTTWDEDEPPKISIRRIKNQFYFQRSESTTSYASSSHYYAFE